MMEQKVSEIEVKLKFIKSVIVKVYEAYGNDCLDLMDKDSLLYELWGASETINELETLIDGEGNND